MVGLVFQDVRSEPRHGWKIETELVIEVPLGQRERVNVVGHDGPGQRKSLLTMQWRRGSDSRAPFASKGK